MGDWLCDLPDRWRAVDLGGILGGDGGTFVRCNMCPCTDVRHGWHVVSVASGWCTHAVCWLVCVGRWLMRSQLLI